MAKKLIVTFAGHRVTEEGVPVDGLVATLRGVQDALKLMVEHLGDYKPGPGQPPKWAREQSRLALTATRPGSLVAELDLLAPSDGSSEAIGLGTKALEALLNWDGSSDSTLPETVVAKLGGITRSLPSGAELWLGDDEIPRRVKVNRLDRIGNRGVDEEEAFLYGRLNAVNWAKGTARLHTDGRRQVPLRFDSTLHDQMLDCATRLVEVRGKGKFNERDQWQYVQVVQLSKSDKWGEPFDLDAFLDSPSPKIFDPDAPAASGPAWKVIRASEPFDVDEFIRFIRSSREDRNL